MRRPKLNILKRITSLVEASEGALRAQIQHVGLARRQPRTPGVIQGIIFYQRCIKGLSKVYQGCPKGLSCKGFSCEGGRHLQSASKFIKVSFIFVY